MHAKYIYILATVLASAILSGCTDLKNDNPYTATLNTLTVSPVYPEGFGDGPQAGISVNITETGKGTEYTATTGADGKASIKVQDGIYRVTISYRTDEYIFNGSADRVRIIGEDKNLPVSMDMTEPGEIVIKEIYCGGCLCYPLEGTYMSDSYIILHNNTSQVQYLDSLCIGVADPYNATGTNVWVSRDDDGTSVLPDFVPVIQAVWKIKGDGKTFPLQPGEDAVVCIFGAIDHTRQYPLSVNLNKPGYFVCYNIEYFPNTRYHPVPGDNISSDRYLDVVIKTGQANAYTFSVNSPAVVIFKAEGTTIEDFVSSENAIVQKPGSSSDRIVKLPIEWVLDGVEVFTGSSAGNVKRLDPGIDAGYANFSAPYLGHTLFRKTDAQASEDKGFEVLVDTNNSLNDFYERNEQSLHE